MNAKKLADILDGLNYKRLVPPGVEQEATQNGLVIVWCTESDSIEFRGALVGSIPWGRDGIVFLDKDGVIKNKCLDEDCPYFLEKTKHATMWIQGCWCATPDYSWTCDTSVRCERFDVLRVGKKYCRGIVFKSPFL